MNKKFWILLLFFFGTVLLAVLFLLNRQEKPENSASSDPAQSRVPSKTAEPSANSNNTEQKSSSNPNQNSRPSANADRSLHSLHGRVVSENGAPIAGASLVLQSGTASLMSAIQPETTAASFSAQSDRAGEFRFDSIPEEESFNLSASHPDFAPAQTSFVQIDPEEPVTEIGDIVLVHGYAIRGSVRDNTGNPIAGALLSAEPGAANPFLGARRAATKKTALTDGAGNFELNHLAQGQVSLLVSARGYGSRFFQNILLEGEESAVVKDFVLDPGKSIAGTVQDSLGAPIANAKVEANSYLQQNPSKGSAFSNASGEFRIEDLAEGSYLLIASAESFASKRENRVPVGSESINIVLSSLGSVSGRVLSQRARDPIRQFSLEARRPLPNGNFARLGTEAKSFLSPDGSFVHPGLEFDKQYALVAFAPGFAPGFSQKFTLSSSQPTASVEIYLTEGGSVRGRIVDAKTGKLISTGVVRTHENNYSDNPLAQMLGSLMAADATQSSSRAAADGVFELVNLSGGTYQVEIAAPGYCSKFIKDVQVREGANTDMGQILLNVGGTVSGAAYDKNGSPLVGAQVLLRGISPQNLFARNARTDPKGRYRIKHLPPGEYRIAVSTNRADMPIPIPNGDGKQDWVTVSLVEGEETHMDLISN